MRLRTIAALFGTKNESCVETEAPIENIDAPLEEPPPDDGTVPEDLGAGL
jgi:hypothetical protein